MKQGRSLEELAAELTSREKGKRDIIADTRQIKMLPRLNDVSDEPVLELPNQDADILDHFDITQHTHRQIGQRVGIPAKYYDHMLAQAPDLLATNVNHWFARQPQRRMVRTLDNRARAFLSDRYRRIDNYEVAEAVLPILLQHEDLHIVSSEVTEARLYLKVVNRRIEREVKVGDPVQAGIVISNSEIGAGSLSISPMVYRLVCLNGMISADNTYRKYHVGARADTSEAVYELLTDETREADDKAILLKVRDVVSAGLSEALFDRQVSDMQETTERKIEGSVPKAVEVLGSKIGLTDQEQSGVLHHLIEGSDMSQWGLLNAVTRFAQDVEGYDRATELEKAGGEVLTLPANDWEQIARAA